VKRLYKSRKDKVISGICGGIGEYFGIDPVLVRVIAVLLFFFGGVGVIAYIVGIIIIPAEPLELGHNDNEKKETEKKDTPKEEESSESKHVDTGALIIGIVFLIAGFMFLMRNFNFFDFHFWWIKDQIRLFFWPGILVALGVLLVLKGSKK